MPGTYITLELTHRNVIITGTAAEARNCAILEFESAGNGYIVLDII